MKEIALLLKRQADLCSEAIAELKNVRKALAHNTAGTGVSAAVHRLEPILQNIADLSKQTETLTAERGAKNLYELLMQQPDVADREVALRLFAYAEKLTEQLKRDNASTGTLLKKGKLFVDFHINVASQTTAEHTYGPPGTAENIKQGRKVFVADA